MNIAPLAQTFSQERFQPRLQEPQSSQPRPPPQLPTDMFMSDNAMIKTSQSFMTSTPQRSHPTFPPSSGAKPSFAVGSASQAGMPSQSPSFPSQTSSQQQDTSQMIVDKEKREVESSRPQEGHDPGPSDNQSDTPDLAIVKIEKVGEDGTGGLLLQVDSGQGDAASQMQRLGQFSVEEEQEYDESDLTGDWSQEDMSNEGSSHLEDPTGGGAMYMGPTSDSCKYFDRRLIRRQGSKKEYSPRKMEMAIQAVSEGKMTQSQASRVYGVPQPTISFKLRRMQQTSNNT